MDSRDLFRQDHADAAGEDAAAGEAARRTRGMGAEPGWSARDAFPGLYRQTEKPMKELITHSRQAAFKQCRRRHYFSYELGLRRIDDARALRMGSAFHDGVEQLGNGKSLDDACAAVRTRYGRCPVLSDPHDWACELETVLRMVCAYQWRWQGDSLAYVAVELPFEIPLVNPETGKPSKWCKLGGKIDAIVRLEDDRLAVKESKLLGDDIGTDSELWRRMRLDHQITLYIHAARELGYPVETVLYDVARKPTIKPTDVPVLDELGAKIVLSEAGVRIKTERGQWRQTGDKEKGWTLQARRMTPEEWGDKLSADIGERPDYYFSRVEVARLDQDVDEYRRELWDIQQLIRDAQNNNRHYRTVDKQTCPFCPYFDICASFRDVSKVAPDGFEFVYDRHPELGRMGEINNGNSSTTETTTPTERPAAEPSYF
jgi:hypothetical protein